MHTNGMIPREFQEWYTAEFTSIEEDPRVLAERIVTRAVAAAGHPQDGPGQMNSNWLLP